MLAKLMFISLVLLQFGCFTLSVEACRQFTVYSKSMYSGQTISSCFLANHFVFFSFVNSAIAKLFSCRKF